MELKTIEVKDALLGVFEQRECVRSLAVTPAPVIHKQGAMYR